MFFNADYLDYNYRAIISIEIFSFRKIKVMITYVFFMSLC